MTTTFDLLNRLTMPQSVSSRSARRYSRLAEKLLSFFAHHRTALASHIQRQYLELFRSERSARMHLQTLVAAGDLNVLNERGFGRTNVYVITAKGLRKHGSYVGKPESEPRRVGRRLPSGSHLQHELLLTEFSVGLFEATRRRSDVSIPWVERFNFNEQEAFERLISDYGFLFVHEQGMQCCTKSKLAGDD